MGGYGFYSLRRNSEIRHSERSEESLFLRLSRRASISRVLIVTSEEPPDVIRTHNGKVSLDTAPQPHLGVHGTNNCTTQVHFGTMQINRATDNAIRVVIHLALPWGSKAQLIVLDTPPVFAAAFSPKSCNAWCMLASSLRSVAMAAASVCEWTATKLRSSKSLRRWKILRTSTCAWQLGPPANASPDAAFTLSGSGHWPLFGRFLPASRSASCLQTRSKSVEATATRRCRDR